MQENVFIEKDGVNTIIANYESPLIQVEEIVVERGFANTGPSPLSAPGSSPDNQPIGPSW